LKDVGRRVMMRCSSNKIYFVVEFDGRVDSYGVCKSEEEFRETKEMLEGFGCRVRRVGVRAWKMAKKAIKRREKTIHRRRLEVCASMS